MYAPWGLKKILGPIRMISLLVALLLTAGHSAAVVSDQTTRTILILHSYHKGLAWTDSITKGIETRFASGRHAIKLHYEFMDTKRIFNPAYLEKLRELFLTKFAAMHFDAIICSDDHAFRFLLTNHDDLFPQTPIVFCGVNFFEDAMLDGHTMVTGVLEAFDIRKTLEVAFDLHPDTDSVFIISDHTVSGKANKTLIKRILPDFNDRAQFSFLENLSMAELRQKVTSLPANSILVWSHFTADRFGNIYSFDESARLISEVSTAPMYSFWDFHLGHGIIGGRLTSGHQQGATAAELVLKILDGRAMAELPVIKESPNEYMFDYEQMKRFHVRLITLPPGSRIINRPTSFYTQNRGLIGGVLAGFVGLTIVIALLAMNILTRRRAEKELFRSKNRYMNIFNTSTVALLEEDVSRVYRIIANLKADGITNFESYFRNNPEVVRHLADQIIIKDINPAAKRLFRAQSKEELLGPVTTVLSEESFPVLARILASLAREQPYFETEVVNRTLDGRLRDVLLSFSSKRETSQGDHILVSMVDITDRKKSEQALRDSEARFRTAFNNATSGMALIDINGEFLRVNCALSRKLAFAHTELLGRQWRDFVLPEERGNAQAYLQDLLVGKSCDPIEQQLVTKSGLPVWMLFSASVVHDAKGRPLYLIAQFQDIDMRKKAEQTLREREEYYRQFFEADLSAVYISEPDGNLVTCNTVFIKMFGHQTMADALQTNMVDYYVDRNDRLKLIAQLYREKKVTHYEIKLRTVDGRPIDTLVNAIGRFDEEGQLTEIQGYLWDMTRQKNLEVQLLQAQKMESIGTMAGGLAHDFNNLLMGIQGNVSLLQVEKHKDHPDQKRLQNVMRFVESGSDLTRQLLGFAKGGKYEVKPINLNTLLERNSSMFGRTKKEITIRFERDPDLWPVDVDRSQIDQVFYNLYVNADQAMPGGGSLYIRTQNTVVDDKTAAAHSLKAGRFVKVSVTDTGIGIDAATQKRIFDPFFTTKGMGRGTGLGLASAYGIIDNHGGRITVDSEPLKGATFNIYLPVSSSKHQSASKEIALKIRKGSERLLIIDDENMILDVSREMLQQLGYTVLTANSSRQALRILRTHPETIDLIILDMIMPDGGGSETFDAIKKIDESVKVLLSSGYSISGQAAKILDRGCQGFLQKPFNIWELSQKVRDVLDGSCEAALKN